MSILIKKIELKKIKKYYKQYKRNPTKYIFINSFRIQFTLYKHFFAFPFCQWCQNKVQYVELRQHLDNVDLDIAYLRFVCEDNLHLTRDHIKPRSKGGCNKKDNIQILCNECNEFKSHHHPETKFLTWNELQRDFPNETVVQFYKGNRDHFFIRSRNQYHKVVSGTIIASNVDPEGVYGQKYWVLPLRNL